LHVGHVVADQDHAEFAIADATTEDLVAAITGASDNVVAERARRGEIDLNVGGTDEQD
jgi:hypothetical protein